MYDTIESVQQALLDHYYVANRGLATVLYLSIRLGKPLFLEGASARPKWAKSWPICWGRG